MKSKITHKQIYKEISETGTLSTTLCGRVNNYQNELNEGMNVAEDFNCKLCLRISKTKWGQTLIKNSIE